jgi:hypothetical protein
MAGEIYQLKDLHKLAKNSMSLLATRLPEPAESRMHWSGIFCGHKRSIGLRDNESVAPWIVPFIMIIVEACCHNQL